MCEDDLMALSQHEITRLLIDWRGGDRAALEKLMPLVYDELRRLARHYLSQERPGHTLQATALVNEAYLRLIDQQNSDWQNRTHFFAVAARIMRHLLVDHARARRYAKRGGGAQQVSLDEAAAVTPEISFDLLALDEALNRLAAIDERKVVIVELRYFGGLNAGETAEAMRLSEITVKREWLKAKAWLYRELNQEGGSASSPPA
jgi:RNA polymerase sigma-70 factor (ECF subfamily)